LDVDAMIARHWRGVAREHTAAAYLDHVRTETLPRLKALEGHRGAFVLQRKLGDEIEFVVLTLWDSLVAVRAFAGEDYEAAVVPPEARRLLAKFDERVAHYDVPTGPAEGDAIVGGGGSL
jgi:heme-degrading monooxygenase HmoA